MIFQEDQKPQVMYLTWGFVVGDTGIEPVTSSV
jgi:hypothetical protein